MLLLGLVSFVLLLTTNWISQTLIVQDVSLVRAIEEIRTDLAVSHLWLEELVTGDEVNEEELWQRLEEARRTARTLAEGGTFDGSKLPRIDVPEMQTRIVELAEAVDRFYAISEQRFEGYRQGDPVGIGSPLDILYDRVFARVYERSEALKDFFNLRLRANRGRYRLLFRTILIAWMLIVGLAVTGLATRERRRRQAEAALLRAQELVSQSDKMRAVGRLAGGLAHDINNYLAAINAQCELVRMNAEPDSTLARRMNSVIQTVYRATQLIRRLLAFSRRQPVQPKVFSLNRVVDSLGQMMQRLIGDDIRLITKLEEGLWSVRADPSQIEQVIVNLVVNARDAMPTGGVITLSTRNLPARRSLATAVGPVDDRVALTVTDTGPGIPDEIRGRVFEPFFTTKEGSTGLGLSTVYGLVEQNGGRLRLHSSPSGTRFRIELPRVHEPESSLQDEADDSAIPRGDEIILLVEDNSDFRTATRALLQGLGYTIHSASSGAEALRLLLELEALPDLLITDVVMPEMSGKELADRVTERGSIPVLFLSGYTDHVVLRHGIAQGRVEFLAKPFAVSTLARKIRDLLDSD